MKRKLLTALTAALVLTFLVGCKEQESKTTQDYLYDHNPDLSSVSSLCNQDNLDNYGSDVCVSQQLNSDGTIKAKRHRK